MSPSQMLGDRIANDWLFATDYAARVIACALAIHVAVATCSIAYTNFAVALIATAITHRLWCIERCESQ